jgi:hypothetical protein
MKTKLMIAAVCAAVASTAAWAAEGTEGHGGSSIVCRNQDGSIRSAELMDLFEGRIDPASLTISLRGESVDQQIHQALDRLGFDPELKADAYEYLAELKSQLQIIPARYQLSPVHEVLPPVMPRGCEPEIVVNYMNNNAVKFDKVIYDDPQFSDTDRAALQVHEVIYRMGRERSQRLTESSKIRPLVALLFADTEDGVAIKNLAKTYLTDSNQRVVIANNGNENVEIAGSSSGLGSCRAYLGSSDNIVEKVLWEAIHMADKPVINLGNAPAQLNNHVVAFQCMMGGGDLDLSVYQGRRTVWHFHSQPRGDAWNGAYVPVTVYLRLKLTH